MSTKIFENMLGQVMSEVSDTDGHEMIFKSESGKVFKFYHYQDCCECVSIEDICGDLSDLVGSPLLIAEEVDNIDTSDSKFHDMVEKMNMMSVISGPFIDLERLKEP
jgi:hypothetical protein